MKSSREGRIEVITGVMFSGKSEELIRRVRRALIAKRNVQLFKSCLDTRYHGTYQISSHDGRHLSAQPITESSELSGLIDAETDVVAVDEVQFLDEGICDEVSRLADQGLRLILVGTDMDFRAKPFGPMGSLMAIADEVMKLTAICVVCGSTASKNQRLIDGKPAKADSPTIHIGGAESYEARCRRCFEPPQ